MSTLQSSAPARAVTPTPSEPPRTSRSLAWHRWISPLAVVVIWQLASSTGLLAEDELASPWRVVVAAVDVTASGELPEGLLVSLVRVVIGLALGVSVGAALGLVSGLSRWGGNLVDPPVQMLRTLPLLALMPLFILWFGIGETPKIAARRPRRRSSRSTSTSTRASAASTRSCSRPPASPGSRAPSSCATSCCPARCRSALVGLRLAWASPGSRSSSPRRVNADAGLGYMINDAREFLRTDVIVVGLVVYALLGLRHRRARAPAREEGRWRGVPTSVNGTVSAAEVRGLTRAFGDRRVLDGLDLDVAAASSSRCSAAAARARRTLLRVLAGLDSRSDGVTGEVDVPARWPSPSRSRACCRGAGHRQRRARPAPAPTRARPRSPLEEVGLDRARRRLAAHPVRRRGPARLAGPRAGPRARAAAARRAVRRPGRADPDHHAPARARPVGAPPPRHPAGHPRRRRGPAARRPRPGPRRGAHRADHAPRARGRATDVGRLRHELLGELGGGRRCRREPPAAAARDPASLVLAGCSSVPRERPPVQPPDDSVALARVDPARRRPEGRVAGAAARRGPAGHCPTRSTGRRSPPGRRCWRPINAGAIDVGAVGNTPPIFAAAARARRSSSSPRRRERRQRRGCSCCPGLADQRRRRPRGQARSPWPRAAPRTASCSRPAEGGADASTTSTRSTSPPPTRCAAFSSGQVDAWAIWDPYTAQAQLQTGARILADRGGLRPTGTRSPSPSNAALADPGARPPLGDLVRRIAEAHRWADTHRPQWAKVWSEQTGLPLPVATVATDRRPDLPVPMDDVRRSRSEQELADAFTDAGAHPAGSTSASPTSSTPPFRADGVRNDRQLHWFLPTTGDARTIVAAAVTAVAAQAGGRPAPAGHRVPRPDRATPPSSSASRACSRPPARGARTPG